MIDYNFRHDTYVHYLGGGSKRPAIAPIPSPIPTPEDIDIEAQRKGEDLRRRLRAQSGRRGTILTEGTLGEPIARTSTILGQVGG